MSDEIRVFLDRYSKMRGLDPELIHGVGSTEEAAYLRVPALEAMLAENVRLREALREARRAFKDCEFTRRVVGPYFCPACRNYPGSGHDIDCYLNANVKAIDSLLSEGGA